MSDRDLIEWDWVDDGLDELLHHAEFTQEQATWFVEEGYIDDLRATCGRRLKQAWIPGPFSRMSLPRCARCCDALGYPRGTGSPKNDPACRPLVEARIGGGS